MAASLFHVGLHEAGFYTCLSFGIFPPPGSLFPPVPLTPFRTIAPPSPPPTKTWFDDCVLFPPLLQGVWCEWKCREKTFYFEIILKKLCKNLTEHVRGPSPSCPPGNIFLSHRTMTHTEKLTRMQHKKLWTLFRFNPFPCHRLQSHTLCCI